MVLSTTKKAASIASITNRNSGGGSKKAGLPHLVARDAFASVHMKNTHQTMRLLKMPLVSTTKATRPVSMISAIKLR
jgi:hypothetical protein